MLRIRLLALYLPFHLFFLSLPVNHLNVIICQSIFKSIYLLSPISIATKQNVNRIRIPRPTKNK